jgi:hypothetical protein
VFRSLQRKRTAQHRVMVTTTRRCLQMVVVFTHRVLHSFSQSSECARRIVGCRKCHARTRRAIVVDRHLRVHGKYVK